MAVSIAIYKDLIINLPVRDQAFTTQKSAWDFKEDSDKTKKITKPVKKEQWLVDKVKELFGDADALQLSRKDLFEASDLNDLIIKTICWGYQGRLRGNNIEFLQKTDELIKALIVLKDNGRANTKSDFQNFLKTKSDNKINGINISTYSKLFYFSNIYFDGNPCLILDSRLMATFATGHYEEFSELKRIRYEYAESYYLHYLSIMKSVADSLQTEPENIEQFLFMFGTNLKRS